MWEEEQILQGDDGFIFNHAKFLVEHPGSDVVVSVQPLAFGRLRRRERVSDL